MRCFNKGGSHDPRHLPGKAQGVEEVTKQHDTIPKAAPVRSEALRRIKAMGLWPTNLSGENE